MGRLGRPSQDASTKRITRKGGTGRANIRPGRGQLSLVEHALCPLDTGISLAKGFIHETEYFYTDENRNKKRATARVLCPLGLSPGDEFFLWGLLALTFSQPDSSAEFYATPHYILKKLGCLDARLESTKGGKNYRHFRQSLARLSAVTYQSKRFYDPIRGEHREVSFGFFEYSLPTDPESPRAWRFTWSTHFFEFCKAAGGYLLFDLDTYRELDFASRRLFLALKKVFYRSSTSPAYDVRHLGVNILGFAPGMQLKHHKAKLARCTKKLAERGIIELPESGLKGLFDKRGVGSYTIQFRRGRYFEKPRPTRASVLATESALYEPLKSIGFDDVAIVRIITTYRSELIQTWVDITLAAQEKHGTGFFKRSPQAYFMDNIAKASQGTRTPPDWWYEYRKAEDRSERESKRQVLGLPVTDDATKAEKGEDQAFEDYLRGEAREAVQVVVEQTAKKLQALGMSASEIARHAADEARRQMRNRFRQEHPEYGQAGGPQPLADILKRLIQ